MTGAVVRCGGAGGGRVSGGRRERFPQLITANCSTINASISEGQVLRPRRGCEPLKVCLPRLTGACTTCQRSLHLALTQPRCWTATWGACRAASCSASPPRWRRRSQQPLLPQGPGPPRHWDQLQTVPKECVHSGERHPAAATLACHAQAGGHCSARCVSARARCCRSHVHAMHVQVALGAAIRAGHVAWRASAATTQRRGMQCAMQLFRLSRRRR
jgi:hypothetical protein